MGGDPMRSVRVWLWAVYGSILGLVVVGGITRLTGSGLSIVDWQPIMGALPPLSDAAWQEVFAAYQASPQFVKVNHWMTLADFKGIFFWEYLHRLLARGVGVVFAVPWLWFVVRGEVRGRLLRQTTVAFILGGLQGLMGWYMVKSGLVDVPQVSHLRLAAHLLLAMAIAHWIVWIALELGARLDRPQRAPRGYAAAAWGLLALLTVQLAYGAFMAGTHAGLQASTFPTMNGAWIPQGLGALEPGWRNPLYNPITIHFLHRMLAWALAGGALTLWAVAEVCVSLEAVRWPARLVAATTAGQIALGAFTVIYSVPTALAVLHQVVGFLLLSAVVVWLHATVRSGASSMDAVRGAGARGG
jgi:cytochrome c oxidase assembly protein subunit 15